MIKILILGAGFGGLNAAKALKKTNFEVLIIDRTNHHLFQPLLYQVATAALSPGEIAFPIREIFSGQENINVLMGEVNNINKEQKNVTLVSGKKYEYDYLIISIGARHSYFGNDAWEKFAPGLKTIKDAIKIRESILISFETAERTDSIQKADQYLTFIIIGGGPTGVEMAGAIAEIAHKTLFKNFRRIRPEKSKIYLVEASPSILPMYPRPLSLKAKKDLEKLGVRVLEGKRVTNITDDGVYVEDAFYPCKNVIWAAGNQASPLLQTLNTPLDRAGRVIVQADLTVPGHPEIFVIGDAACVINNLEGKDKGKPLPAVSPVAIQQGKYVANIIKKRVNNPAYVSKPFQYFDKGSMATIGKAKAVSMFGSFCFSGFIAWLMWCFVHVFFLIGFRNRVTVILEWMLFYITGQRGARLIYSSIESNMRKKKAP